MESWREELYHHGILGQKWGVKNGPPYPLDDSDHSIREKNKQWKKSLDKSSRKEIRDKARESLANKLSKSEYAQQLTDGKRFLHTLALGQLNAIYYENARAMGVSRGKAFVDSFMTGPFGKNAAYTRTALRAEENSIYEKEYSKRDI